MAYLLRGTNLGNCHCHGVCPCNVDLPPSGPEAGCKGWMVLHISEGHKDDVDLSGVNVALVYSFPGKPSEGNWKIGIVADTDSSDEQAQALEAIFTGKDGGPWGDFAGLFGDYLGLKRARVTFSDGDAPSASVEGSGELTFEPLRDMQGQQTVLRNAVFAMGPELKAGQSSGHVEVFDMSFDAAWGELTEVEFAS
jgi:hypothetical protein